MNPGFYSVEPREGASAAGPFPWTPSPLGMDKSVIVGKSQSFWYIQRGQVTPMPWITPLRIVMLKKFGRPGIAVDVLMPWPDPSPGTGKSSRTVRRA